MKLFFRIILKIFLILTILVGYATTEEIEETNSIALLNQRIAYDEKGQYDLSITYFNEAIEINPSFAEAYNNRGVSHEAKDQHDKAIADYNNAL